MYMFTFAAALILALPWLNPFSLGPTPAVPTLLFSWACTATFFMSYSVCRRYFSIHLTHVAVAAWLIAGLLSALIGLMQYFGYSGVLDGWINITSPGEAFGNLRQRNHFATLTNIALAALVYCVVIARPATERKTKASHRAAVLLLSSIAAVLLAVNNAASSSRTGLMQLLLLLALSGLWGLRARQAGQKARLDVAAVVLLALLAYALAAVYLPVLAGLDPQTIGILARLHENGAACSGRLTLWSNVMHLIAQKPWFGWGWNELGYAHFITLYPGTRFCDILDNAHNLPLHIAVELGVPAAIAFCTFCTWAIWRARPWSETNPTRQLAWTVLAMIAVHSLLEYPLWYGPFQMAAILSVWLLWRTPAHHVASPMHSGVANSAGRPSNPVPLAALGVVILGCCAYASWDYWRVSQIYAVPAERAIAYQGDTLGKINGSWLFRNQVRFAELGTTPLTPQSADRTLALAEELLHFSAEPSVVQKIIESAALVGNDAKAQFYLVRFTAAFPQAYAQWSNPQSPQQ